MGQHVLEFNNQISYNNNDVACLQGGLGISGVDVRFKNIVLFFFFFNGTNDSCSLDNRRLTFGILLGGGVSRRGNGVWSEAGGFCIEKKKGFLTFICRDTQLFPYRKGGTLQPSET